MGDSRPSEADVAAMYQEAIDQLDFDPAELVNQLNDLVVDLTCDGDCQREKVLAKLEQALRDAEKNLQDAPQMLATAERNYYVFKDTESGYAQRLLLRYNAEADAEGTKLRQELNAFFKDYDDWIKVLVNNKENSTLKFQRLVDLATQYVKLRQLKYTLQNTANVSGRKVLYEEKAIDKAQRLRIVLIVAYFLVLLGYLIFGNFFEKSMYMNKGFWVFFVLYVSLPWVLNWIVRQCFALSQNVRYMFENLDDKNVYLKL
jgi:hypothetical protein